MTYRNWIEAIVGGFTGGLVGYIGGLQETIFLAGGIFLGILISLPRETK